MAASNTHQFIADLIHNKLQTDGYTVIAYDGKSYNLPKDLNNTIKILRHRPDLIGVKGYNLAIGEAKTAADLTVHTLEQIKDFISLVDENIKSTLYMGIPLSAEGKFKQFLRDGNVDYSQIYFLTVPDRLLP